MVVAIHGKPVIVFKDHHCLVYALARRTHQPGQVILSQADGNGYCAARARLPLAISKSQHLADDTPAHIQGGHGLNLPG